MSLFKTIFSLAMYACLAVIIAPNIACLPVQKIHNFVLAPTLVRKKIYVPQDFTTKECMLIFEAADEWQTETHGLVSFEVIRLWDPEVYYKNKSDNSAILMTKITETDPALLLIQLNSTMNLLGYFLVENDTQRILIIADRMRDDDYYRAVIIHELGHSIGLYHTEEPNTIMYANMEQGAQNLTKKDIAWFCRSYQCNANLLGGL